MARLHSSALDQLFEQGRRAHTQKNLAMAATLYKQVLARQPQHAGALQLLGLVHYQQKNLDEAVPLLRKAVALAPNDASAQNNLGNALIDSDDKPGAIKAFREAVRLNPRNAEFIANMGRALRVVEEYEPAVQAYLMASELEPQRARFHSARGEVLLRAERFDEAAQAFRKAVQLGSDDRRTLLDSAAGLREAKLPAESLELYQRLLQRFPNDPDLHVGLAFTYQALGRYSDMVAALRLARALGATGTKFEYALMFRLNHVTDADPVEGRQDAQEVFRRVYGKAVADTSWPNDRDPDRRLRIGLVSPDFRSHPVGRFLAHSLPALDPSKLELFGYAEIDKEDDPIRKVLHSTLPHWCPTDKLDDDELASRIRDDAIDILIDLAGYTAHNRLAVFARKPAPVSVTWLGYFATTGFPTIDYVLANDWLIPPGEEDQWVEKPWRLPDTHWSLAKPDPMPDVTPTPALAAGGVVTFGTYNNFEKISPATIALWVRLLNAVPNARLKLRYFTKDPQIADRLKADFVAAGIAAERLEISTESLPYFEHLQSYGDIDIALDPFPYNGGTTTAEALIMGVPVLTLRGDRFVSHLAETNIQAIGLKEWVAEDADAYVEIARRWAADIDRLNALRLSLRETCLRSKLFDAKRFATDFEEAMHGMWKTWCLANPA